MIIPILQYTPMNLKIRIFSWTKPLERTIITAQHSKHEASKLVRLPEISHCQK